MRRALLFLLIARLAFAVTAPSTTHLWSPVYPTSTQASAFPAFDTLRCNAWVPEHGIDNATAIAWYISGGLGGGAFCSLTVYTDDGSAIVRSTGALSCAATGAIAATGLSAFTLVEGTKYQVCVCASATGGSYLTGVPQSSVLTDLENVFSGTPLASTAANPCLVAVPPSSTGALTTGAINPPVALFETSTP